MVKIDDHATAHAPPGAPAVSGDAQPDPPPTVEASTPKPRRPRGFAAMDRKLVTELARKGGKAAHLMGAAHEFSSDEARAAGRKGGLASHEKRRQRGAAAAHGSPKESHG